MLQNLPTGRPAPAPSPLLDAALVAAIDRQLADRLAGAQRPDALAAAMRYALLGPGKRVRAVLAWAAGRELGTPEPVALALGCAVEMVHAASLVMDDLPAMDDAQQRRGRAATHRVHGEAVAMLAAVGLIAEAFALLAGLDAVTDAARARMVQVLARATGRDGLCGGQCDDLHPPGTGVQALARIGHRKTGALFTAAVELSAHAADAAADQRQRLQAYAHHVGLAFQVGDDLLDDGQDDGRPSHVALLGRGGARALLRQHVDAARAQLPQRGSPLDRLLDALFAQSAAPTGPGP